MKKVLLFIAVVTLASFQGCNALKKLTQFRVNQSTDFSVPSSLLVNVPISLPSPDITTNSSQTFANNNTSADMIESVKLEEMKLTITAPSGKSFSFLKDIQLYLSAPNLPEVLVAEKLNVSSTTGELLLDVKDVELKEYLKKDKLSLRSQVLTDEVLTQSIQIKADSRFFVDAKGSRFRVCRNRKTIVLVER